MTNRLRERHFNRRVYLVVLLAGCAVGEDDGQSTTDSTVGTDTSHGVMNETGLFPGDCAPTSTTTTTPTGAWATAMPTIAALGGTATVNATWEDGTAFSADVTVALDTSTVWVQSYNDPMDCPDEWALMVDNTFQLLGSPVASGSTPQLLQDASATPVGDVWEFQGVVQLQGADSTKATAIAGYTVTEATYVGVWDANGMFAFGMYSSPAGSSGIDEETLLVLMP